MALHKKQDIRSVVKINEKKPASQFDLIPAIKQEVSKRLNMKHRLRCRLTP